MVGDDKKVKSKRYFCISPIILEWITKNQWTYTWQKMDFYNVYIVLSFTSYRLRLIIYVLSFTSQRSLY